MYNEEHPIIHEGGVKTAFGGIALIILGLLAWEMFKWSYGKLIGYFDQNNAIYLRISITLIILIVATLAFIVRQNNRKLFGFLELVFGLIACYEISYILIPGTDLDSIDKSGMYILIQVAAPVFIIGRAFDNIVKGVANPWELFSEKLPKP